jgi:hypothetical protein
MTFPGGQTKVGYWVKDKYYTKSQEDLDLSQGFNIPDDEE